MNLARQASVSSAPGLGGGRGDSGLRGEAIAALLLLRVAGGAGLLVLLLQGLVDGVHGRVFGLLSFRSFEWVRVRAVSRDP